MKGHQIAVTENVRTVAVAVGTRPEFVQMEPLLKELTKRQIHYLFLHSGQHYYYELDKIFFEELNLPVPTHYLGVGSASPGKQLGDLLIKAEHIFQQEQPDILIISGDTNTTLGLSLAATKLHIPVGHMEAGMRSFDKTMPEEINRIVVDHISSFLFPPTEQGMSNIQKEGLSQHAYLVGDIMLDSFQQHHHLLQKKTAVLEQHNLTAQDYFVLTLHREANTDDANRLTRILHSLSTVSFPIVFPMHPRTKKKIQEFHIEIPRNIIVIPPLSYLEFLRLISSSKKVLTDSGGVQKQAYFLSKPCITLRPNTEWMETVQDGWNILVDDNEQRIRDALKNFKPKKKPTISRFGDGKTAEKIVDILLEKL